jgi:hypothetical protein
MLVAWQWLRLIAHMDVTNLLLPTVLVWALLACALAGYDRIAGFLGVCGTTAIIAIDALSVPAELTNRLLLDIARFLVPLICFTVMAYSTRPGRGRVTLVASCGSFLSPCSRWSHSFRWAAWDSLPSSPPTD